ncbi:hypothetical protein GCM10027416_19730 [Okibacterium endophyticum]
MTFVDESGPVPAKPAAWPWRVALRFLAALVILAGPAMIVTTLVFVEGAERWISLGIDLVVSVVLLPFGIWLWVWMSHEHKQSLRLRKVGVPASAEVLDLTPASYGEESGMRLTVQISGPGVSPFHTRFTCAYDSSVTVGDRLGAIVDPGTNAYAIPTLR